MSIFSLVNSMTSVAFSSVETMYLAPRITSVTTWVPNVSINSKYLSRFSSSHSLKVGGRPLSAVSNAENQGWVWYGSSLRSNSVHTALAGMLDHHTRQWLEDLVNWCVANGVGDVLPS